MAFIDVTTYGAVGDGSTNDTTAINNALAAVGAQGVLYFPPGTYVYHGTMSFGNQAISFLGDGPEISVILEKDDATLLQGTYTTYYSEHITIVQGLTLCTDVVNSHDAINVTWTFASGIFQPTVKVINVWIRNETEASAVGFKRGIVLNNAYEGTIRDVQISGHRVSGSRGIHITGESDSVTIDNLRLASAEYGIFVDTGGSQGIIVHNCVLIDIDKGIVFDSQQPEFSPPFYDVSACHISSDSIGIRNSSAGLSQS